jgi:hypothetical protein
VIAHAADMFLNKSTDECRVEIPALQRARRQQRVGEQLAQAAAEPDVERDGKALLAAVDQSGGKQRRGDFFEDVFAPSISDLQRRRQRECEVDDLVVEQGHTRFDRVRHARAVHLRQDVVWKIRFDIEPHHLARPRQRRVAVEDLQHPPFGIVAREPRAKPGRVETRLVVGVEEADGLDVPPPIVFRDVTEKTFSLGAVRKP